MMSQLPYSFVYIASLQSANEHPLTPCGCVFHTLFWIQSDGRPHPYASDIFCMPHSVRFIPSLDFLLTTSSSTFSRCLTTSHVNQPASLTISVRGTSDSPHLDTKLNQVSSFISLHLVSSCLGQALLLHHICVMLMMSLSSFAGDNGFN